MLPLNLRPFDFPALGDRPVTSLCLYTQYLARANHFILPPSPSKRGWTAEETKPCLLSLHSRRYQPGFRGPAAYHPLLPSVQIMPLGCVYIAFPFEVFSLSAYWTPSSEAELKNLFFPQPPLPGVILPTLPASLGPKQTAFQGSSGHSQFVGCVCVAFLSCEPHPLQSGLAPCYLSSFPKLCLISYSEPTEEEMVVH